MCTYFMCEFVNEYIIVDQNTSKPTPSPVINIQAQSGSLLFTPTGGDTIVCPNNVDFCIINCNKRNQCRKYERALRIYSGAKHTILNCNQRNSCIGAKIFIGKSESTPEFIGAKSSVIIECKSVSSCADMNINIEGNFIDGVDLNMEGEYSFENSILTCNLLTHQSCDLSCRRCGKNVNFICLGGNCQCNGEYCPNIYTLTQNPTLTTNNPTTSPVLPTTVIPTVSPSETTGIPSVKPSPAPTTLSPTKTRVPTVVINMRPDMKPNEVVICPNNVTLCAIKCNSPYQCGFNRHGSVKIISAAKDTVISCNNKDSCFGIEIYLGIPTIIPYGYTINDFIGEYNSVQIDCNQDSSCRNAGK